MVTQKVLNRIRITNGASTSLKNGGELSPENWTALVEAGGPGSESSVRSVRTSGLDVLSKKLAEEAIP